MAGALAALPLASAGAAAAYRIGQGLAGAASEAASGAQSGFAAMLSRAAGGMIEAQNQADAASSNALQGRGSVTDVVVAVSRAELALQTATTLRDRVVSAYQDVMRMPI
ncbi:flagellar hook-basal body complex protein FliE [Rhodovarius crocodyli]|uniref:Flagellar hook-basal body complex protein FliE n=1 Tax=Rhodovarius crocodyli TaxID=1979269 RepID=A0A437LVX6_9PROT|nr:flagellar hook-basal body complex protein FliE [Rhodovarius crocodyli]RVT89549.1 flagellar hook-basal body complex protein FliE [Rhodovarius crocodyli]